MPPQETSNRTALLYRERLAKSKPWLRKAASRAFGTWGSIFLKKFGQDRASSRRRSQRSFERRRRRLPTVWSWTRGVIGAKVALAAIDKPVVTASAIGIDDGIDPTVENAVRVAFEQPA